jgi:hypothetical protein
MPQMEPPHPSLPSSGSGTSPSHHRREIERTGATLAELGQAPKEAGPTKAGPAGHEA